MVAKMVFKKEGYITLKEIEKKYGKSQHTVRDWIRKGKLKAQIGVDPYYPHEYYVKLEDWIELPTFMRDYRSPFKRK